MIESYTPIPLLVTPKSTAAPGLFFLYSLLGAVPFYAHLCAGLWAQENHQAIRLYFILWFPALVVTVLLDYLSIVHIWRTDSVPLRTNLLSLAWLLHGNAGFMSLMRLNTWAMDKAEMSLGLEIVVYVVTGLVWIAVAMGVLFGIMNREWLRERLVQRRIMIGIWSRAAEL